MTDSFPTERRTVDSTSPPPTDVGGRRRFLVGDLVVQRVTYRSVARVALPVFAAAYVLAVALGVVVWNVASLSGWSPAPDDPDGAEVLWSALAPGAVIVPFVWLATLGLAALYNGISRWTGGVEIAIISPRGGHHRRDHH